MQSQRREKAGFPKAQEILLSDADYSKHCVR
jgi:hypothetical protein